MSEIVKFWIKGLLENEINEACETIKNEHIWELGYNGEEPNPHTESIEMLKEYIEYLEEMLDEIDD